MHCINTQPCETCSYKMDSDLTTHKKPDNYTSKPTPSGGVSWHGLRAPPRGRTGRPRGANAREAGEALRVGGGTHKMTGRRPLTSHKARSA